MRQGRKYILAFFLLLACTAAHAANFSYVYIQGDKQTPFYVKFEDVMLPRYGKNYSIIPQLSPGPIHIRILFQQNVHPPQDFTILVPEDGFRGFLLTRKGEEFSLYDIHQQFYLPAGNKQEEDHLPEIDPAVVTGPAIIPGPNPDTNLLGEPLSAPAATPTRKEPAGPAFMDIELNRSGSQPGNPVAKTDADFKGKVAIVNSDCPRAIDHELFEAIHKKAKDKGDEARLKYLLDKTNNNCFTSNQVRILARMLRNDPERYTFLKKAYPRVTDQSAFPALESLLNSREWKDYFKLILP